MGGRGTVSVSGGEIFVGSLGGGPNDIKKVGGWTDKRDGIHKIFEETGFSNVVGLNDMDTAVLGAYGIALNRLEKKYGALGTMEEFPVVGMDSKTAVAAVRYDGQGNANGLLLNRKLLGNISSVNASQELNSNMGWSMPTDGKLTSKARYAVTHEYGHILETALWKRDKANGKNVPEGTHARQVKDQIIKIAQTKYGGSQKDLSQYGASNSYEFFAEAFASANSGNPTAIGKAMDDYLKANWRK